MPAVQRFDRQKIDEIRGNCHESLYYFQRWLCGLKDMEDCHHPLSQHIQKRHRRSLIGAHRGFFKSSMGLSGVLWDALEIVDYTQMVLSQREELSKEMLERIRFMVTTRPLIQEVYQDRFPANLDGWNTERLLFVRKEAHAGPSIIIGSLRGRQESRHVNHLYCDDLEGADANISDAPNEESEFFVRSRAEPLLISPATDRITVVGTPHGKRPLVEKLRKDPVWTVSWTPLVDENFVPAFPQRFPVEWCREKQAAASLSRAAKQLWEEQLMLRPWIDSAASFDIDAIRGHNYQVLTPRRLRYEELDIDLWKADDTGHPQVRRYVRTVNMEDLRYYIHCDPKHRDPDEMKGRTRPSTAAVIVIGVSPDFHGFLVDTWIKETGNLAAQMLAIVQMYEKWAPFRVTWEAVGAQKWLLDAVKAEERRGQRYISRCPWFRKGQSLPRLSVRMEESQKGIQNKERQIVEALDTWLSLGLLHLHDKFEGLYDHLSTFPSEERPIDAVDAMAQGPAIWSPPRSGEETRILARRARVMEAMNPAFEHSGYRPLASPTGIAVVN